MIVECPGCHLRHDVTGRPPGTRARCRCGRAFALPEAPTEAASLACPGCGAPASPEDKACGYCATPLATARCPRCFALLFRGVKHCAACGASADAPAHVATEEGQSERQCPRCSATGPAPLDAQLVAETLLDQCPDCGGLWVDETAFERLTRKAETTTTAGALGTLPRPHRKTDSRVSKVTYLRCPDCESLMNRRNYGKRSGVIVDVCSAHGIWFDDEELTRVLEFVRSGGLQETRRQEAADLREERRRLESLRATDRTLGGSRIGSGAFFGEGRMGEADLLDVVRVLTRIF